MADTQAPAPEQRSVRDIAREIKADWTKVHYAAVPYVDAMLEMGTVEGGYGGDTGEYVISRFLTNAGTWRGETARRVKAELKGMIGKK